MHRLDPIASTNGFLQDLSIGQIQLHLPASPNTEFGNPLRGLNVNSLDIVPRFDFHRLTLLESLQHRCKIQSRFSSLLLVSLKLYFAQLCSTLLFNRLNPPPLLLDLQ